MSNCAHGAFTRMAAVTICTGLWLAATAGAAVSIIPLPVSIEQRDGSFPITQSTSVVAEGPAAREASKLIEALTPALGYRLKLAAPSRAKGAVQLRIEPSLREQFGEEGYELEATTEAVVIRAAAPAGLFYGILTLRQLLPPAACGKRKVDGVPWTIPCIRIKDQPRFAWRGLLIDPARHFIPVPDVEQFIDTMALYKFNRLQIHLTDDQGWRIEIKKYP